MAEQILALVNDLLAGIGLLLKARTDIDANSDNTRRVRLKIRMVSVI